MSPSGIILAALVSPALAWGGALAVAGPIVIHLLARRRFRRIRWAAMDFLIDAEKRNRRRVRLEELILLALRCLAVFLIGLLLARPFIRPSGVAALLGGRARMERIFVLDDSFSMGYLTDGRSAFSRAKASVVHLLNRLREHAPHDTVTLLRTSRLATPDVTGAVLDDQQTEHLLAQLEAMKPSQQALSAEACLAGVRKVLDDDPDLTGAVVYLLSDFQRHDWIADTGAPSLADPLAAWAKEDRAIRLVLIDVGDDEAENLAVTQLRAAQPRIVAGVETTFEAKVGNYATREVGPLDLDVTIGQARRATARLDRVPAGGSAPVLAPAVFQRPGETAIRIELPPDNLSIDNVRQLAVEVRDAVAVLVVNGEPASDPYDDEVHLLAAALRPEGDVSSGNRLEVLDEAELDGVSFEKFDVVMLCNVYRVSEPVADALRRYVFGGGGLAVFLGDQVADPEVYNAALYRGGDGLLPAALRAVRTAAEPGVTMVVDDEQHPVMRVFAGRDNPFLQRVHFQRYYVTEPFVRDRHPEDPPGSWPSAHVLARYADPDATPAIIERLYGKGRVMLFTSACDLEWNDWAKDPSYVVAMLETVRYLARGQDANRTVVVGQELDLDIDPGAYEPTAILRGPAYPQEREETVAATFAESDPGSPPEKVSHPQGGMRLTWKRTARAGVYTFVLRRRTGEQVSRRFAVNLDPAESDLAPADEEGLRHALTGVPLEYIAGVPSESDAGDEGRHELWPLVLAAALGMLMLEQFLAWRFGRG